MRSSKFIRWVPMENKMSANNPVCKIIIGKNGMTLDMNGLTPSNVTNLFVVADIKSDLHLLAEYPNVETLLLSGKFTEVDSLLCLKKLTDLNIGAFTGVDFSPLKGLPLKKIKITSCSMDENFSELFSESVEYMHLYNIKKAKDLSFIEKAPMIKKLYLESISAAETLPDFKNLKQLYALKLYELHKLNDMEKLADSSIEYLDFALVADKLSGTQLADILCRMRSLKQADMHLLDRNDKRYPVLKNRLTKEGRADLLGEKSDYDAWMEI